MSTSNTLLRAIFSLTARQTFSPDELAKIVAPQANSQKQIKAYNLCDGNTSQAEVGKKADLDKGNLSRSISRWIDEGVMFRIGDDQHPLHLYPLPKEYLKSNKTEKRAEP